MTDSSTSTKKPVVDAYLTIEKELYHILNLFKQREKEKEKQFDEWVQKGLNLSHFFDSHPEFLVEVFSFRLSAIQLNGTHSAAAATD